MTLEYPWYLVMPCLLAGAAYAAVLYFVGRNSFGRRMRWLLAALRFVAVSAIAFLLLAPMTRRRVHERQQPHVVVAVDRSLSVRESGDSAFVIPPSSLGRLRITTVDFGNDAATDIGSVLEELAGSDADAVVLATDGIYNRGANPASVAEHLAMPVYTVALGDTTPRRDASVGGLRSNRVAMLGSSLPVEFTVSASLLRGRNAQLSIVDAHDRSLHQQRIAYADDLFSQEIGATLPVSEAGLQRFTIRLSAVEGEVSQENNVLSFYVDVIDTRRRVAIVANAPHPDLAALHRSIEANPNYEAEVMLAGSGQWSVVSGQWPVASGQSKSKNSDRRTQDDYSLIIYHNLPSAANPLPASNSQLPTTNSIFIVGQQTDLPRFNALHTGLEINARAHSTNEVTAIYRPAFSLFTLPDGDAEAIEQLPPLSAPFGEAKLAENVQTLFAARLGNIDTRQPLVAATVQGETRRTFVWGEGLWRWRLADYAASGSHDRFDRLVQQLVAFAAMQDDHARLRVEADRTYPAGQPVTIRAQLYNESYQLTNTPEVSLGVESGERRVENGERRVESGEWRAESGEWRVESGEWRVESGERRAENGERRTDASVSTLHSPLSTYIFHRDGEGYSLTLPDLKEGIYHYRATGDGQVAEGSFAVEALGLEQRSMVADHTLLRTISETTGGQMYHTDELSDLLSQLSKLKPVIYSHTRYSDLVGMPLALILILLLLAIEWGIRKYKGEL